MVTSRKNYTYNSNSPKSISTDIDNTSESGGSIIVQPEIIEPMIIPSNTPSYGNINQPITQEVLEQISTTTLSPEIETATSPQVSTASNNSNPLTTSNNNSTNPKGVASATTDQTKNYVGGGTTPNSPINVKKPRPNYLVYGIIGLIGLAIIYKVLKK
jgi:hypothetical protein